MSYNLNNFLSRLKFIRFSDILQVGPMLIGAIGALFIKLRHRNIWLVCERKSDARDNGYWFFKYMKEQHPEIETIYAIDKQSPDYKKVAGLGKTIQFGSLNHWLYYWAAEKNISSQKEGKPNAALCMLLEVILGFRQNRVYLKHGIIKDYQQWVFKEVSKFNLIICGAKREYDYMLANFGYDKTELVLTGLSRFDNLLSDHIVKRQILVMPTHRDWLRYHISSDALKYEATKNFMDSEYFIAWNSFINSSYVASLLEHNNVELIFYLHATMQQFVDCFSVSNSHVKIALASEFDVQQLLMESAVLITDYSSVYFDFAYMNKPLIYYQFDYEKYREGQYQQGYFSYKDDGFGPVVYGKEELEHELGKIVENNMELTEPYKDRVDRFFSFHDTNNRERTYNAIINMNKS